MSRGMPSMTALLAVLAMAGYQHRDKLSEMLGSATRGAGTAGPGDGAGASVQGGGLAGMLGGSSIGTVISDGIRDLVGRFRQAGQGEAADSWVAHGPNHELAPGQLERAIDSTTLEEIARQTGLSHQEIVARLTREVPNAVDKYTPDGRLPEAGPALRV